MNILVTNNSYGTPLLWEYDQGKVKRMPLIDFNTHIMIQDPGILFGRLPLDLYEIIIKYVMADRLATRNFGLAFELLTINRRTVFLFYYEIYKNKTVTTLEMLKRLGKTFQLGETIYEDYVCAPNPTQSGLNAISLTRNPSQRFHPIYQPWDFQPSAEVQRVTVDDEDTLTNIHIFPGQFHGDTIWVHGTEEEGIYQASVIHNPVFLIILCDYTYSLIPTRQTINRNWLLFTNFMRRAFGANAGFYIMVKHGIDQENPFIETTELFIQI